MNIILFIIIFILVVYFIYKHNTIETIETITNIDTKIIDNINIDTKIIDNINIDNKIIDNNNLSNINIDNNNLSTIPKELDYNNFTFNFIGTAINKFYNQKYYLYESKNDQYGELLIKDNLDNLNEQIYSYIFVIFINNQQIIQQEFGPRNKINIKDIIYLDIKYLSNGISYIGPYIIL